MGKTKITMNCPICEIRCSSFGKHRVDAQTDEIDEWVFEEVGKPLVCLLPAFRLLQLLPYSQNIAYDARDGGGYCRRTVGDCGPTEIALRRFTVVDESRRIHRELGRRYGYGRPRPHKMSPSDVLFQCIGRR